LRRMKHLSDKELLQKFLAHQADTTCFDELYRRYAHLIYGMSYKFVQDKENAQSILNDTFLQIKKIETEIENIGGWLQRVARNKCLDYIRQNTAQPKVVEIDTNNEGSIKNDFKFVQDSHSDRLIGEEFIKSVLKEINSLEDNTRDCALLRFLDGQKYKEIADTLSLTEQEVRNHIKKARYILRQKFPNY
jgi:RNA polymerase sigma factor (sigma-70 family)